MSGIVGKNLGRGSGLVKIGAVGADSVTGASIADDAVDAEHIADNAVGLVALASGTDGNLISYDTSGDPVAVATGTDGQVLTSAGAGAVCLFEDAAGGGTSWQAIKTSTYTASAGQGVFANTTGGAFTVNLPSSPSLGDEVSIIDYAGTFDSNTLTVGRNSEKIQSVSADMTVTTERAAFTLVYVDSTHGWLLTNK
jgi:hypothetical protein